MNTKIQDNIIVSETNLSFIFSQHVSFYINWMELYLLFTSDWYGIQNKLMGARQSIQTNDVEVGLAN